ncbi:MAG TPA: type II secretion system protein, partial [Dehalococcoidia bacterium]|nr:type II secretion system protein [Dehalococcoidia bacterium]
DIVPILQQKEAKMRRAAGFTLIELMVVMAIMAILVGVVLPGVTGVGMTGKLTGRDAEIKEIQQAVQRFNTDTALWPTSSGNLPSAALVTTAATTSMLSVIDFDSAPVGTTKVLYPDYMMKVPEHATDTVATDAGGARTVNAAATAANPITQPEGTVLTLAASQSFSGAYVLDRNGRVWVLINAVEY